MAVLGESGALVNESVVHIIKHFEGLVLVFQKAFVEVVRVTMGGFLSLEVLEGFCTVHGENTHENPTQLLSDLEKLS